MGSIVVIMRRVILLVLDGCGAGAAPDAALFGDGPEVSTLKNVWHHVGGFVAPHLGRIGFLQSAGIPVDGSDGRFGRLQEVSMGKDSVTGHWEMMGIRSLQPFPTYPDGFPEDLLAPFREKIGREVIGNKPASGTAILSELGEEHMATGEPIVYTSADSVFQIAAHEEIIPISELYRMCEVARELCVAPHNVQRVIARPFVGQPGAFSRTERRKDYPLVAAENLVDQLGDVFGIGVVPELFGGRGFRPVRRTQNNAEHALMLQEALASDARFIFANFEDFDMLYGHRSDPVGFAKCLEDFDAVLAELLRDLREEDLLILTADHGNDPTDASTDHTREYVPVALVGKGVQAGSFGDVVGMDHIGATVAAWLGQDAGFAKSLLH